jgi:hypothetical protein
MTLSVLITYRTVTRGSPGPEALHNNLTAADTSGALIVLLGVIGMTGEWRHQTITIAPSSPRPRAFACSPRRYWRTPSRESWCRSSRRRRSSSSATSFCPRVEMNCSTSPTIADVVWRSALVAAILGALSVCLGALVCNQTVAVAGGLIIGFVVDPLLQQRAPAIARFEPLAGLPNSILDGFTQPARPGTGGSCRSRRVGSVAARRLVALAD